MRKTMILGAAIALIALGACSFKYKEAPSVGADKLPLAKADYTISGETSGEACRFYLFHAIDFGSLFGGDSGTFGQQGLIEGLVPGSGTFAEARFKALTKMPDATYIIDPKYDYEDTTYFIFGKKKCVTVKARAVVLKGGPVAK